MSTHISLDPLTLLVKHGLVDKGDGTIFDTRTKLLWQQSYSKHHTWEDALTYCKGLKLAGHKDWRLPTIEELKSLIEKEYRPTICPVFKCESVRYWSSSSDIIDPTYAWYAYFGYGYDAYYVGKDYHYHVRAVCSGL